MSFFSDAFHLFVRSMKKLVRNPILVFFSLFQPIIFLLLFTQLFSNLGPFLGAGILSYTAFATAGIVLQNAFSSAFQSGTAVVDDIKSGFLAKMLATPVNRSAILMGRLLSDVFRVVAQTVIILILAYALGVYPATGPIGYLLVIFTVAFFGLACSGISSAEGSLKLSSPSIEAVNLSKRYGSFLALSNLSLKIEGSKCVGFLGPNGAGKTTTLKIFTDMIRASEGKALINGIDVHLNKKKALSSVGSLIESPEIYPSLTPREALSMVSDIRGLPRAAKRKKIEEDVVEVKMEEWLDKKVGKFSKGMKQRINIAAALLSDPDVFLLDEPTTGLDARGMADGRAIVKSLKTRNRLIV